MEHPLEQPGPAQAGGRRGRERRRGPLRGMGVDRHGRKARHRNARHRDGACLATKGRSVACLAPRGWNDSRDAVWRCVLGAPSRPLLGPGFRCEHAMEADQMQAWTGDKRSQALHQLQR
jgi:hypothetical protein